MNNEDKSKAWRLGYSAFKTGAKCSPMHDTCLVEMMKAFPAWKGRVLAAMTEWEQGWTFGNLEK